jgi:hypothetical protein
MTKPRTAQPWIATMAAPRRAAGRGSGGGDSERGASDCDTRTESAGVITTGDGGPLRACTRASRREVRVTDARSGADDRTASRRPAAPAAPPAGRRNSRPARRPDC